MASWDSSQSGNGGRRSSSRPIPDKDDKDGWGNLGRAIVDFAGRNASKQTPAQRAEGTWNALRRGPNAPYDRNLYDPQTGKKRDPDEPVLTKQGEADLVVQNRADYADNFRQSMMQSDSFSAEEFAALTPRQQAYLQAQTQLWNAVQEDRFESDKMLESDRKTNIGEADYSAAVDKLFTASGGSDKFAPRTVAALTQLKLGNELGDLDLYLDGNAFLTKGQIINMGDTVPTVGADVRSTTAWALGESALDEGIAPLLQKGQSILGSLQGNNEFSYAQGMEPRSPSPLDGLTEDQGTALRDLMDGMMRTETPEGLGDYYDAVTGLGGITPAVLDAFLRSQLEDWETKGAALGEGFLDPTAFRERWGITS